MDYSVNSLLDTDLYKLTMMQAVLHNYSGTTVHYKFKCRNGTGIPRGNSANRIPGAFMARLSMEFDNLCSLKMTNEELEYIESLPFFKKDFVEYLRLFQLNRKHIRHYVDGNNNLQIEVKGPWLSTILFEVPVLSIVARNIGLYSQIAESDAIANGRTILEEKIAFLKNNLKQNNVFKFADFGTRRRFSFEWQRYVLNELKNALPDNLVGTSNVFLAKELNIKAIGTMAHEWLQAHQQLGVRLVDSQKKALDTWVKEYRGDLGIALTDVGGFDWFLSDFDKFFAKLFDGCRHDSGDPFIWCKKLIQHYERLGIPPIWKTAVFSDGLNFKTALELYHEFHKRINISFGIGTNLTNDLGTEAPSIVMKLVECNNRPVAKISDSLGKGMCEDEEFLSYFKKVIHEAITVGN